MGRLIDISDIRVKPQYMQDVMGIAMIRCEDLSRILADAPTVEAIPKADYENRLKADMVAMLRFLWNDIENLDAPICDYASSDCISKWQVHEVIQQKIDSLKGGEDATVNYRED